MICAQVHYTLLFDFITLVKYIHYLPKTYVNNGLFLKAGYVVNIGTKQTCISRQRLTWTRFSLLTDVK